MLKLSILNAMQIAPGETSLHALRHAVTLAKHADRLGFERYWLVEHHGVACEAPSAPEVLLPVILGATNRIKVGSGGVLLNHHSPYRIATNFRVIDALYPGRVDLGFGHAPTGEITDHALKPIRSAHASDDYNERVLELMQWLGNEFPPTSPFANVPLMPDVPSSVMPWLLSASLRSVDLAANLGLPLVFSGFHAPSLAREAIGRYRENFRPSSFVGGSSRPQVILALRVIAAETEAEAELLAMSLRFRRRLRGDGRIFREKLLPLEDMIAEFGGVVPRETSDWPHFVIGSAEQVRECVMRMARETCVDEVMMQDFIHDPEARLRSCELLAEVFALKQRQ